MHIEKWFPVAFAFHDVDEQTKQETEERSLAWIEKTDAVRRHSEETVLTSYHSRQDLFQEAGLDLLQETVLSTSVEYLKSIGLFVRGTPEIESWINVFNQNSSESEHEHFGASVSGCYYVSAPPGSGQFFFRDPIRTRVAWQVQKEFEKHPSSFEFVHYQAVPGRMLVFPPWLTHAVAAHVTKDPRISIAFNIRWK